TVRRRPRAARGLYKKTAVPSSTGDGRYEVVKRRLLGAGRALLALNRFPLRLVAFCFLDELLRGLRILFEERLRAQQQPLEDQRIEVIGLQRERLVDGLLARLGVLHSFFLRDREVLLRLFPVVAGDHLMRLGIVRLLVGALLE